MVVHNLLLYLRLLLPQVVQLSTKLLLTAKGHRMKDHIHLR